MTPQPATVRPGDELADAAGVLLDRGVRAVRVAECERRQDHGGDVLIRSLASSSRADGH
jgi:hypothetical protein